MLKQARKTFTESLGRREEATLDWQTLILPWNVFLHPHEDMFILPLLF